MAFTRKFLLALGVEEAKVESIMDAHIEVVDALKKDRDTYKSEAEKLPDVQKELDELKAKQPDEDYKKKYEDLVKENQNKETMKTKTDAYRKALESAGVGAQFVDLLVKANRDEIEKLELDESGAIKDTEQYTAGLKTSLKDYIPSTQTKGTKVSTPPKNNGGNATTRDEIMAIKDDAERQQAIADHMDLFQ